MISRERFVRYCIVIERTHKAICKIEDSLGGIVIDCEAMTWFNAADQVLADLMGIEDKRTRDNFCEAIWDQIMNGETTYFLDGEEVKCDNYQKCYEIWADIINEVKEGKHLDE